MRVDIEWDEAAFIVALMKLRGGRREKRIARSLVADMREYDADSCGTPRVTMTPGIRKRVAYWTEKIINGATRGT